MEDMYILFSFQLKQIGHCDISTSENISIFTHGSNIMEQYPIC